MTASRSSARPAAVDVRLVKAQSLRGKRRRPEIFERRLGMAEGREEPEAAAALPLGQRKPRVGLLQAGFRAVASLPRWARAGCAPAAARSGASFAGSCAMEAKNFLTPASGEFSSWISCRR